MIEEEAGKEHLAISTAFIGTPPSANPVNMIHIFTSGQHEAVLKAELRRDAPLQGEALRERLRARFAKDLPGAVVRFEPGDIVGQVMSFGASTPIEVAVQGANLASNRAHAEKLHAEPAKLAILRDIQFEQTLDYPSIDVEIDRLRAAQFGLTMESVARSMVAATSSSRFIQPNYWRDPGSGNAFQIQVEIPYQRMDSLDELRRLPVMHNGAARPLLSDVATIKPATAPGIVERNHMQRVVSLTANLHGATPGVVAELDIILAEKERDAARMLVAAFERSASAARAQTAALREMEAYLRIAAPFDGVITARHAHPGALASPESGALLELEQVSRLRLVLPVPEAELGAIRPGLRLSFTVPAHPGRTFTAAVARIPRSLDPATRTMPIELDVSNPNGVLAPGMYCEVAWPARPAANK